MATTLKYLQVLLLILLIHPYIYSQQATDSILLTLNKTHPRLIATSANFEELKTRLRTDTSFQRRFQVLLKKGNELLDAPVNRYVIPDGLRLLATSRSVVDRVYTLAFIYQVTNDEKFAARAWKELDAAARFPDWNPKHFLDVGEMTHAFAIGYDWLYDYLTAEQRQQVRHAIIEHGLSRALFAYTGLAQPNMGWWVNVGHNWNQVCNGGIGIGALAIADEEPKLSEAILRYVVRYLPTAMKHYGPDGAWDEGPGYWAYATMYNVALLAAMETALGKDFGLSSIEGFSSTALFPVYLTGPINKSFNYADGGEGRIGGASLAWLARKFNDPFLINYQLASGGSSVSDLLWNSGPPAAAAGKDLPPDRYFRNAEVVTMRSGWNDANALFVGFKAGDNKANHSHLDLGSFILDGLGERWIVDLGAENYNVPGYFNAAANGRRWTYYRTRAESHNTLVFNPRPEPDQDPTASTRIIKFNSGPLNAAAVADLSAAYARDVQSVKRGIALAERKRVIVRDEIEVTAKTDVNWFANTRAVVSLDASGRKAVLTMNNKRMEVNILSPAFAKFEVMEAKPMETSPHPEGINKNTGITKLRIHIPVINAGNIVVEFKPATEKKKYKGKYLQPLSAW